MSSGSHVGGLVIVVLALLIVGSVVAPVYAAPEERTVHIVRHAQTFYSIARSYGLDVWTVARANGIANPSRIYEGQHLVIPTGQAGRRGPQGSSTYSGRVHIVQPGETLYRIALNYGVSTWSLVHANHIANPNCIYAGQRLVIA